MSQKRPFQQTISSGAIAYESLQPGEILKITAVDAYVDSLEDSLDWIALRMIGSRNDASDTHRIPIFQVIEGTLFFYERRDGRTTVLENDVIALGGTSANHLPETTGHVVSNAIVIGKNWSLRFVDGKDVEFFTGRIVRVERYRASRRWQPVKREVDDFNAKVEALLLAEPPPRTDWREHHGPLTITTGTGKTYRVSEPLDGTGDRRFRVGDSANVYRARLNSASVGGCLVASMTKAGIAYDILVSDRIVSITPHDASASARKSTPP